MTQQIMPSPGTYTPIFRLQQSKVIHPTINTRQVDKIVSCNKVGPGYYSPTYLKSSSPNFTISNKLIKQYQISSPGPGQYTPSYNIKQVDACKYTRNGYMQNLKIQQRRELKKLQQPLNKIE